MIVSITCSGQLVISGHWGGWEDDQLVVLGEQGQEERIPGDQIVGVSYRPCVATLACAGLAAPRINNVTDS